MKKIKIQYDKKPIINELDLYLTDNPKATVIHFHGGGFVEGDKCDPQIIEIAEEFINRGYNFAAVNYSLYPDAKFPLYLFEAAKAIKEVTNHLKDSDIYVSGTSAGAYIAMMLAFNKEYLASVNINPLDIKGWVFESGQPTSHFNLLKLEKGLDPYLQRIDELAPLYYIDENTRLSKALFILYNQDLPNRYEQNQLLISALNHYYPSAHIEQILLNGTHCLASSKKDSDGRYPFTKLAIDFIK